MGIGGILDHIKDDGFNWYNTDQADNLNNFVGELIYRRLMLVCLHQTRKLKIDALNTIRKHVRV